MNRKQRRAAARAGGKGSISTSVAAGAAGDLQQAQTLLNAGSLDQAAALYQRILETDPKNAPALHFLGVIACQWGELEKAESLIGHAIQLKPDYADAYNNLAGVLVEQGHLGKAKAALLKTIELSPDMAEAHYNLGNIHKAVGRITDAIGNYELAIALMPDYAEAHNNLGIALKVQGNIAAAEAAFRRAMDLHPKDPQLHSNLIFLMDFDPDQDQQSQQGERRRWAERHATPLAARIRPHGNSPDPARPLRIGYVSADFYDHSAALAFGPVVRGHDPKAFEVTCYSSVKAADDITERFRDRVAHWRDARRLTDAALAEQVRSDGIDILVDLSGHSEENRLLAFAERPAPVQITAWGHPTGTGLKMMDYVFSDSVLIPPEERGLFAEEIFDLPSNFLYEPPDDLPPVTALPAEASGHVTFGCLNRREKISIQSIEMWSEILNEVPDAHLLIKARELSDDTVCAALKDELVAHGIGEERLILLGNSTRVEHLAAHNRIDIALDPFPQGGGISTADALWMGVPVVTFPGQGISARIAASILTVAGLDEFIAEDPRGYRDIAVAAAGDLEKLSHIRAGLRQSAERSLLGDVAGYVQTVEAAYRDMWRRWCVKSQPAANVAE